MPWATQSGGGAPRLVDAPVSGGVGAAANAALTFMVGGPAEAAAAARPLLDAMGTRVVHLGGAGMGQAAKLCNNLALGVQMAGVSEALALGCALGLDPRQLSDVMMGSSGRCWSLECNNPVPVRVCVCVCVWTAAAFGGRQRVQPFLPPLSRNKRQHTHKRNR